MIYLNGRPPAGIHQEPTHRPLAGILQPSVGIPIRPVDVDDEQDQAMENLEGDENATLGNYQPLQPQDKTSEVSLADFTHDQSIASGSFAAAARMASTPFCSGIGPMSLPNIPWSTIRPTNEISELNDLAADGGEFPSTHGVQASGSFISTPNKVLSPIFEGSQEDSKSTNSSHSPNGSSRRVSCSASASHHNGLELSKIQEETSMCQAGLSPEANSGGCSVVNPFAGDVVSDFLVRINPPLSTYEGFVTTSEGVPRIAANASVSLGRFAILLLSEGKSDLLESLCKPLYATEIESLSKSKRKSRNTNLKYSLSMRRLAGHISMSWIKA